MRSFIIALGCLSLFVSCGAIKKGGKSVTTVENPWQPTPIAIDGDSKDWPSPYPNFDSKSKIAYATSNDNEYLYVTCETGDELTQVKILKAGMRLCIDTNGHKSPSFFINYPLENTLVELNMGGGDKEAGKDKAMQMAKKSNQFVKTALEQANQLSLEGFGSCNGGYTISQMPCGIKVKIRMDEFKELVWEAAIPLKLLKGGNTTHLPDVLSVCFELKALPKPKGSGVDNINDNMTQSNASMGGNRSAMGGAAGGRGMGGGRGGGRGGMQSENPMETLFSTTKTWKVFKVANK